MDLHPRLANALVWACKQRGDWRGYASKEARARREPNYELTERLTKAPKAVAKKIGRFGVG